MATEIERKFLVLGDSWRSQVSASKHIKQGYLTEASNPSVRIRVGGERAVITVKGGTDPLDRSEFEYEIPLQDAHAMLDRLCAKPLIDKVRNEIRFEDGRVWEVDEFSGHLDGLILAEIELQDSEASFTLPDWAGPEVTHDARYLNSNLQKRRPD